MLSGSRMGLISTPGQMWVVRWVMMGVAVSICSCRSVLPLRRESFMTFSGAQHSSVSVWR
jgi:hypothetical protein